MLRKDIKIYFVCILLVLIMCGIFVAADISGGSITGVLKEEERRPEQLFDIIFEIDDARILSVDELVARLTMTSVGTVPTPINVTYIILDEIGERVHLEQELIVVETGAVIKKKFEGLDLDYGIYRIFVRTLYNEDVEDEFWKEFEIRRSLEKSLFQLFDISFSLDDNLVSGTEDLVARANFESFGSEPTPVKIDFTFLDANGNELYSEGTYEIVETEKIVVKKFGDLGFENGKYSLVLKILYNVDVEDEFVRKFEIREKNFYLMGFWVSISGNLILGFFIFRMVKKSCGFKKRKSKRKNVFYKKFVYR